ncbi:NAD(P)-binding protein [Pseudactinotalea sp. HY160]|uniref:FAD-dependent oxidoreductase n=1 Tax=Pseudactinotalea sp. HY160 TaxID=2654490 RepID=UPI00128C5395|nr:NAD(P)/FAD-dependent oxidoreductase [Pseudactinotalea sp. HY160]MPV50563.1 NAD(P)-binding protein [Pseudactinotalea sp. HY160]
MIVETPAADQLDRADPGEPRILVVGAGIAGTTLAQLLRRAGRHPVLIERHEADAHADRGYMLALMPMVDSALDELGAGADYRRRSQRFDRYRIHSHRGRMLRTDPIAGLLDRYGDYRGIDRGALLDCLAGATATCEVAHGTTVSAVERGDDAAPLRVCLAGARPAELEVDLIVAADGIGSTTRGLLHDGEPVDSVDTGWGGWVVWARPDADPGLGSELWGDGFLVGAYPVLGALGAFLGGPRAIRDAGPAAYAERVRRALRVVPERIDRVLTALVDDPDPFWWPLVDARAGSWVRGRSVLLGDAAAGFLPTAGIGAGMAIESAWVLARHLTHAHAHAPGAADLDGRLAAYERAQRPRVTAAHDTSRRLASLMCRTSLPLAVARDVVMRFVSIDLALRPIQQLLAHPPDLPAPR